MYKCKNNMWDIVAPIKVGGYHIANLYAGWFFFENEPVDYKLFLSQARQEGFNEEEYIATLEKAPRLSREAVEKDIDFLLTFAKLIEQRYISCPIIWLMSNLKTTLFKSTRF